jgi:hypothetical protein
MWHSCGKFELDALFAKSEPHVRRLFDRFAELVQSVGPVTVIPQKSRVVFQVRVRFAGAVPRKSHLLVSFGFPRRVDSPRFHKIEQYAPRWYGHSCKVTSEADFDEEFMGWIREAYAVGEQKHLA